MHNGSLGKKKWMDKGIALAISAKGGEGPASKRANSQVETKFTTSLSTCELVYN